MDKTVLLKSGHTHAGVVLQAGSTLTVDEGTAKWLFANGIAVEVVASQANTEVPPSAVGTGLSVKGTDSPVNSNKVKEK